MKKFWITALCIAVTVISLAGCGTTSGSSAKNQPSGYIFTTGEQQIYINEEAQKVTDALGEPSGGTYEKIPFIIMMALPCRRMKKTVKSISIQLRLKMIQ